MDDLEFDLMIKEIMIHRKPEHFLDDIFMNIIEYKHTFYPNCIFYKKDGLIMMYYSLDIKVLYYNFTRIYLLMVNKFKCDPFTINIMIESRFFQYITKSLIYATHDNNSILQIERNIQIPLAC